MAKGRNLKKASLMLLIMLPVIYIGFGWYVGLSHGCKSVIFGPYSDIPVAVKTSLLGSSLEDISGQKAIMMVVPLKDAIAGDTEDTAYFKRAGYFEIPGSWKFNFRPYKDNHNFKKTFILTGSYSHAICHDIKNPGCNIGSLSVEELNVFLARSGRYRDAQKLKPYLFISRLEAKYPWAYSETVLVSRAMGNILKDNTLPYDVLGLFGIVVLFIALGIRSFYLWLYYLYWVASYWFARIGYHDPILGFTSEGWHVIFWSFWHGFIVKEGRIFLVIAIELSVIIFGIFGALNISRQMLSFLIGGLKKCGCRNYRIWSSSRLL